MAALVLCGTIASPVVAAPGGAVVAASSDEEWLLISARDRHDVLAELDEAAARGYRFIAMSWTSHEFGVSGLNCLMQREESVPWQYRFIGGGGGIHLDFRSSN